ncbi:MAG: Uma2 family endonuclease [Myxococcales bacterium]|nr:Uma2 family endonuclease [Myxococcales bacterium]
MRLLHRPATRADLDALPPGEKGEIVDGVLYTQPRPRAPHQEITSLLADDLVGPYRRGRGGPGGWWILVEPGIALPEAPEVAPDLAGWRRERLASLPREAAIELAPDWACEIHSPTTRGYDLVTKRRLYERIRVGHLWYVDPEAQTLRVSRLEGVHYVEIAVHGPGERPRCEPFDAVELELDEWWAALA